MAANPSVGTSDRWPAEKAQQADEPQKSQVSTEDA